MNSTCYRIYNTGKIRNINDESEVKIKRTHKLKIIPLADPKNDTLVSTAPAATFFAESTVLANVSMM